MSRLSPDAFESGDPQRLRRRLGWIDVQGVAWLTVPAAVALAVAVFGMRTYWPLALMAVALIVPGIVLFSLGEGRRNTVAAPYLDSATQSRAWWWGVWLAGFVPPDTPPRLAGLESDTVVGRIPLRRWPVWLAAVGCALATAWLVVAPIPEWLDQAAMLGAIVSAVCGWVATVRLLAGRRAGRVVLETDADEIWIDFDALHDIGTHQASRHSAFALRWTRVRSVMLRHASNSRVLLTLVRTGGETYTADLSRAWLDIAALEACVERYTGRPPDVETR